MPTFYDIVLRLTEEPLSETERRRIIQEFASHFGWTPSDNLTVETADSVATSHLVVEHGLENTAVLSFLKRPFADLGYEDRQRLLSISYNNLVDWHVQIEREQVSYVFNRTEPAKVVAKFSISRDELSSLSSHAFEKLQRPNANLPALDEALIGTIRFWKTFLSTEIGNLDSNEELSALFNAIIFTRAVEDNFRRIHFAKTGEWINSQALIEACLAKDVSSLTLRSVIERTLVQLGQTNISVDLVNKELLSTFDGLTSETVRALVKDFYRIRGAQPYEYDFSLMSKHALSKIYERYVTLLRVKEATSGQTAFYFASPEEQSVKNFGGVYTPQYIARFFARYLRAQMPPIAFKRLKTLEPAIGSGIFLRTLLEMQCDPLEEGIDVEYVKSAFANVAGLDIDPNAILAAILSLSLLHLVLTSELPQSLDIRAVETIDYFQQHNELKNKEDVVLANPPFIPVEDQDDAMRKRLIEFMGGHATGRIDTSLAFLKLAVEALKPGGYGLFVLPYAFLLGNHASGMRELLMQTCWIRCLVDLSAIRVFDDTSAYVVLIIFQKKAVELSLAPYATIVKCQDFPSRALQYAVEDLEVHTDFYSVYHVSQSEFALSTWVISPPAVAEVNNKLRLLPRLKDFIKVQQGVVTGQDKVFLIPESMLHELDSELFLPYLSDREMEQYTVPSHTAEYMFYPSAQGRKLEERELEERFEKTWKWLLNNRSQLEQRAGVRKGQYLWWQLERPRDAHELLHPKIVTPHIVLTPRFGLDSDGNYAISRSFFMSAKEASVESDLLRYFIAILNSTVCFRWISEQAHKYRSGYSVLEVATLRNVPVPDPKAVSPNVMRQLLNLVHQRLTGTDAQLISIEQDIDSIVLDLYGLTRLERQALGLEVGSA